MSRQKVAVYAGGRQYLQLTLYAFRFYVFLDLWLGKGSVDSYLRYDIVNYGDFCLAGSWMLDLLRASLLFQIDVNECVWGLIGSLTDDTQDCSWGTYYINQPFLDFQPIHKSLTGQVVNTCKEPIPIYNSA